MKRSQGFSLVNRIKSFKRCEDGSFTIEAVIWMPIFVILLAIIVNVTMMFFYKSQMLRVAQDATRAYSLGRFTQQEASDYIKSQLNFPGLTFTVGTADSGTIIETVVTTNAAALMPFNVLKGPFEEVDIGIASQYIIEY